MKVEIDKPFTTAAMATLGALFAVTALIWVSLLFTDRITTEDVAAVCVGHLGVQEIFEQDGFLMEASRVVICRDGFVGEPAR